MEKLQLSLKAILKVQLFFLLVSCASLTQAQVSFPVTVKVYGQNLGNRFVYHYRLNNNSQSNVAGVWIGYDDKNDSDSDNDVMELSELPFGWDLDIGIPQQSAKSPPGWRVAVLLQEECDCHALEWMTVDERGNEIAPDLTPGQVIGGMSVVLAKADPRYVQGHANIQFSGIPKGSLTNLTVPLEREDVVPPSISVKVNPSSLWPPNGKPVFVKALIEVKDNLDPNPIVRLESIASSEALETGDIGGAQIGTDDRSFELRAKRAGQSKQGRIYTITYSATDATGNTATASATVTVPHDQGK